MALSRFPQPHPKVFHKVADTLGGASAQGLRVELGHFCTRHVTASLGEQRQRIGTPFGLAPLRLSAQLGGTTVEGQMSGQSR